MNPISVQDAHFLYVEDDPSNRLVMSLLMEKALGTQNFVMFDNSADFMARVKALPNPPDLVMLDIHVRPHDGFEMLKMLRSDPDYRHVKVIALTASVMDQEVERLRSSGFSGAIGKPLKLSTFPALLAKILQGEMVWYVS